MPVTPSWVSWLVRAAAARAGVACPAPGGGGRNGYGDSMGSSRRPVSRARQRFPGARTTVRSASKKGRPGAGRSAGSGTLAAAGGPGVAAQLGRGGAVGREAGLGAGGELAGDVGQVAAGEQGCSFRRDDVEAA